MKTCTKCGIERPLDAYGRDRQKSDGLTSHCKACKRAAKAKYYAENRETVLVNAAEYRSRPDVKARLAEYQAKHAEEFKS